jgi:hypothetical protein
METLNSHPDIALLPELYNHAQHDKVLRFRGLGEERFEECIHYLEAFFSGTARYTGCKILLNQLELISRAFPAYFMQRYRDAHFIFLYRRNLLHAHISLRIAHASGVWHRKKNDPVKKRTVRIDPADLYAKIEQSAHRRAAYLRLLEDGKARYCSLSYEDLFAGPGKEILSIFRFLDIPGKRITFSTEKKGNPFAPCSVIENFDEVKLFFQEHPEYYHMLLQLP